MFIILMDNCSDWLWAILLTPLGILLPLESAGIRDRPLTCLSLILFLP